MNEQLTYEHEIIQKLETISLPDENAAWIDMRRRLDEEEDDDGIIIPPLKSCGLFILIGIALLLIGSLLFWNKLFKHQNIDGKNTVSKQIEKQKSLYKKNLDKTRLFDSSIKNHDTINGYKSKVVSGSNTSQSNSQQQLKTVEKKNIFATQNQRSSLFNKNNIAKNKIAAVEQKRKTTTGITINNKTISDDISAAEQNHSKHADSSALINDTNKITTSQTDTVAKKITAQQKQDSSNNKKQKETSKKQHKNSFTAGLTEHQQIPFGGQTFLPFNAEGLGGTLLNYLPSVFFRVYLKQKFFLQLDLRYRAPELIKPFNLYYYNLKKIYYHQLPLSTHYNFNSHLSVGTGIIFNRFSSAIAKNFNTINPDSTAPEFLKIKSDSSFKPIYLQGTFETEYKWKKLSLGIEYEQGLQPFIRKEYFINSSQEKNPTLQIFLRYELWRSKKK